MGENILRRVKENLSAKFYLTNDTWLTDCVEYYLSEHNNPNDAEVLEFVISQWLLSDLREISNEKPSLPKNLSQQKCTTLRGHFILQMEKVYDIAESKYKQLEKIRNVSTDNIRATELEATQAWEPKKKRMLQFHLTDGSQDVTAIEYKPVRFLNDKLLPGYKLLISGPVTCRRGVIMLDETNISEIGGEVETLLVINAHENVLARALNLPENPDPYNDKDKPKGAADGAAFDDDFDVDMEAVDLIEKSSQEESTSRSLNTNSTLQISTSNRTEYRNNQSKNDYKTRSPVEPVIHEIGSDLLFDMIDENEFKDVSKVNPESSSISKTTSRNSPRVLPQKPEFPVDDEFEENTNNVSDSRNIPKTITNKFGIASPLDMDFLEEEFEFEKATKIVADTRNISKTSSKKTVPILSRKTEFPDDDEFEELMEIVPNPQITSKSITRNPVRVLPKQSDFPDDDDDLILITDNTNLSSSNTSNTWQKQSNDTKNNHQICEISKLKIDANSKQNVTSSRQQTVTSVPRQSNQMGNKRTASVLSPPFRKPPAEKVRCTQSTPKIMKANNRKITDYLKKEVCPDDVHPVPKICDNISDLLTANLTNDVIRKTVRSKFNDFHKLTRNGDSWILNATLMDETGRIDVVVSSEILEKIIGYSVAEFRMKKKQKKHNPEVENELRQSMRSAETKIRNLDALLEVELAPDQKPIVVKMKDFTDEHKKILERAAKLHNT